MSAPRLKVLTPTLGTLKKYGLSVAEWRKILRRQHGACFVCEQVPTKGRLCIDHEHVRGWKHQPPTERKKYVRGLLCFRCNTLYVGRAITLARAKNVVKYLEEYEERTDHAKAQESTVR